MLKTVLWIAAACAAVLVALAVSRRLHFDRPTPPTPVEAPAAPKAAVPAAAIAPATPVAPKPPPTPEEQQVQDDAAATGMTTVEPEEGPKPQSPPTN
ncbi:hypothetical protein [Phenylobacterium sp.]|uniref:hypothetical protein n=1 Tax=Phenylobacterium sp. TaxID=1871053 RepID=UPI0025E07773|nr:hypothetical protein [Phenylobacterium sp.]